MENKSILVEVKTLDEGEQHLALEMLISRTAHTNREREKTPIK
jgi:hypothetical protein